jgi:hypothetical protein
VPALCQTVEGIKMKIKIWIDEIFPCYWISNSKDGDHEIELTDKEIKYIYKAEKIFNKAQDIIERKLNEAEGIYEK